MRLMSWAKSRRPLKLALAAALAALVLVVLVGPASAATPDSEQVKLTAGDAAAGDSFGRSVAIDGDTAVVGAPGVDDGGSDAGAAYVIVRSGGSWSEQAKLTASDAAAGDSFGSSVAIDGDTVVVGAPFAPGGDGSGAAYVFVRSGGVWSEQAKLTASDAAGDDNFGSSVAISGDTVVVGSFEDDDAGFSSGSAYVFVRSGVTWSQQQKLTASDAAAFASFGVSVAVSADTVAVGAIGENSAAGAAYVFVRIAGVWTEQQKLTASDGASLDGFGHRVALSGDTAVFGAHLNDDVGADSGSAYVFVRSSGTWTEQQKLTASDAAAGDRFGGSVALSGGTALVGAFFDDDVASDSGSAYVFVRSSGSWSQQDKLTASDASASDQFGRSLAISGDTAVVGVRLNDDAGASSGSAYVFVPTADLSMAKSANLPFVPAGTNLTYTLTVTNEGPSDASGITVTDTLPGAATFVSASAGCTESGGTVTCTAASLANAASVQFTITVTAPGAPGGNLSNTASVTSNAVDPDSSDDSATLVTLVANPASVPGLTTWGLAALALGLGALVIVARRRRAASLR